MNKDYRSEGGLLEEARRGYAASKARDLSSKLQEVSVAKFEVDHLPEPRKVRHLPPTSARALQHQLTINADSPVHDAGSDSKIILVQTAVV